MTHRNELSEEMETFVRNLLYNINLLYIAENSLSLGLKRRLWPFHT